MNCCDVRVELSRAECKITRHLFIVQFHESSKSFQTGENWGNNFFCIILLILLWVCYLICCSNFSILTHKSIYNCVNMYLFYEHLAVYDCSMNLSICYLCKRLFYLNFFCFDGILMRLWIYFHEFYIELFKQCTANSFIPPPQIKCLANLNLILV